MKAAKAAQEAKQRQAAEQDAEQSTGINRAQCMRELVESGLLRSEQGETVLGALTRLGHERKAAVKAQQKAHKASQAKAKADTGGSMELDGETNEEHRMNEVKAQVERLTTLAGTLMDAYGETEVYDWTFDDVVKDLRLEGEVPRVSAADLASQVKLAEVACV